MQWQETSLWAVVETAFEHSELPLILAGSVSGVILEVH